MKLHGRTNDIRDAPLIRLLQETDVSEDVISLGQGIPFFPPPSSSIDTLKMMASETKGYTYSTDAGLLPLRSACQEKLQKENNINVSTDEILITSGANQGFLDTLFTITHHGDEILFLNPSYFNYVMATQLVGCKPIMISSDAPCILPSIQTIEQQISKKTRAIVTISPNNPTGMVYPKSFLKQVNQLCADHQMYHISDEVYEYFVYDDSSHISPAQFDQEHDHTISLFSCSKSFGMSGYRIGWCVLPEFLFSDMIKVQDTMSICAPVPGQYAAINAVGLGKSYMNQFIGEIDAIRHLFFKTLQSIEHLSVYQPQGAMYFFVKINKDIDPWKLAKKLIHTYKVITIPGTVFDAPYPSLRVSFGNLSYQESKMGIERLEDGLIHLL